MGRGRKVIIGRVDPDQAEAIKRLAAKYDRTAAWIQRRALAIGLKRFTMPKGATSSAGSATDSGATQNDAPNL